jgi:hypothetical protein
VPVRQLDRDRGLVSLLKLQLVMAINALTEVSSLDLQHVVGGAGANLDDIGKEAAQFCPDTVGKYTGLDPSTVNREMALKMGDECLAEGQTKHPLKALVAKKRISDGINLAFPQ